MTDREKRLFEALTQQARHVGGYVYNSDIWYLLGLILAYYESRGTSIDKMLSSENLRELVARLLSED